MRVRVFKGLTGLLPFASTIIPWKEPVTYVLRPMKDKARPRQTIAAPTTGQLAALREQFAGLLAQQRITAGVDLDYSLSYPAALAEVDALVQDTTDYSVPHARPTARRASPKKPKSPPVKWLEQAAEVVTTRRRKRDPSIDAHQSYQTVLNELKNGYFNPAYWVSCEIITTDFLSNVPVTTADTVDRSYAYPDPTNTRTLATYGDGSPAEGPPRYSGNTLLGEYRDSLLVWQRTVFELENEFQHGDIEPTFIEASGTSYGFADQRGSRPMMSWIMKTWNVAEDSALRSTVQPPTNKPWSWYYRYKLPASFAPYYGSAEVKKVVRTMRQPKHEEHEGSLTHSVVIHAPRPMYGRGFNNNTGVTTQLELDLKIWQIKIAEDDPPIDRVYMWGGKGVQDVYREFNFPAHGLYVHYYGGTNPEVDPYLAEYFLGISSWCPFDLRDNFRAAVASLGPITSYHSRHFENDFYAVSYQESGWIPETDTSQQEWTESVHYDTNGFHYIWGFIWSTLTNEIIALTAADFYTDEFGLPQASYARLDSMKTDTNTLYDGTAMHTPATP